MQKFKTFDSDASLMSLIESLSSGQHIIGIVENEQSNPYKNIRERLCNIVTQKKLMGAILERWPKTDLKANEIAPVRIPICINKRASAKTAFEVMAHHNLSCLAVVQHTHPPRNLVNQISTR